MRHPINQYMSAMNHFHSKSHTNLAPVEKFKGWNQGLKLGIDNWADLHTLILSQLNDVCVIFYEELQENPIQALTPCLRFLGFELNETLKKCVLKNQEGYFRRKKRDPSEMKTIMSFVDQKVVKYAGEVHQRFKSAFIKRYMQKNTEL